MRARGGRSTACSRTPCSSPSCSARLARRGTRRPRSTPRLNGSLPVPSPTREAAGRGHRTWSSSPVHEEAAAFEAPPEHGRVDLSGAHRLRDAELYERWYGFTHPHPGGLKGWELALPELAPPTGRLIANPAASDGGATGAGAARRRARGRRDRRRQVGRLGAGRASKQASHAGFVLENLSAYRVGSHQHAPEIEQVLGRAVCFVPHLLPIKRGLLATCYVGAGAGDVRERLEAAYAGSPVVRVLPEGSTPSSRACRRPTPQSWPCSRIAPPDGRSCSARRQPGQGRRRAGGAERQPGARAGRDAQAPPDRGDGVSVTAPQGFLASGVRTGIRASAPDLALVRSLRRATGAAPSPPTGCRRLQ